jgi:class 3 adenylate cyclase
MNDKTPGFLVVEDEDFNRGLLIRHLKREGYEDICEARDGKEALEVLRKRDFDLVLSDIQMPEMDGYELLRAMKADMRLRGVPVVVISAVDQIDSIVQCIELGAEDYLPKPFDPVLLRARVGASLEKKKLRDKEKSYLSEIKAEKRKSDELLAVILPEEAAGELKATGKVQPRRHPNVAVLFCDVVGFTAYCDRHDADEVVANLQRLFERCEEICHANGLEKIKTVGDAFMATAGLLKPNRNPLLSAVKCGLEMAAATHDLNIGWEMRSGVHAGPLVAGIVGRERYQFDVWGDTVNMAARMAALSASGTVAIVQDHWIQVQDDLDARLLGPIEVKGKGRIDVVECYGLR